MANRMCSLCGEPYTDETGHDYDKCVESLQRRYNAAQNAAIDIGRRLTRAKVIQKQGWWRKDTASSS